MRLLIILAMVAIPALCIAQDTSHCYHRLEGTIAGKDVIVNLSEDEISYYYYKDIGEPISIQVKYNPVENGDSLNVREWLSGIEPVGQWKVLLDKNGLASGVWISEDSARKGSIHLQETYPVGSYKFACYSYDDSIAELANRIRIIAYSQSSIVIPDTSNIETDRQFLSSQISQALNSLEIGDSDFDTIRRIDRRLHRLMRNYVDSLLPDMRATAGIVDPDNVRSNDQMRWGGSNSIVPRYNDKGIVVLDCFSEAYEGGAHGSHWTKMICLDVIDHRTLALGDVTTANTETLRSLLGKFFRKKHGLKRGESLRSYLFRNEIDPNNNFFITDKGLGFHYQPYEIAPYSEGELEVFIPFTALKGKLTPWVLNRFQISDNE